MLKLLLAGADVAMTASALLKHGPGHISDLLLGLSDLARGEGIRLRRADEGLDEPRDSPDPAAFERPSGRPARTPTAACRAVANAARAAGAGRQAPRLQPAADPEAAPDLPGAGDAELRVGPCGSDNGTLRLWQERSAAAALLVSRHAVRRARIAGWLNDAFLCIHHYEGAWTSNTGNGYYGGLQMDQRFMSRYGADYVGRWGTADNWPTWAQLEVAARAHDSGRGFTPWPNTARSCGLL